MTVGECCNRQVVIARRDERVLDAACRMRDSHVGTLVVVDDEGGRPTPVGLVTDRDLVIRALCEPAVRPDVCVIGAVMSAPPVTAREADNLWDAVKKMRSFGVRRLLVVNDGGGLEGILSVDDLIDLIGEELSDVTTLVSREQAREREETITRP